MARCVDGLNLGQPIIGRISKGIIIKPDRLDFTLPENSTGVEIISNRFSKMSYPITEQVAKELVVEGVNDVIKTKAIGDVGKVMRKQNLEYYRTWRCKTVVEPSIAISRYERMDVESVDVEGEHDYGRYRFEEVELGNVETAYRYDKSMMHPMDWLAQVHPSYDFALRNNNSRQDKRTLRNWFGGKLKTWLGVLNPIVSRAFTLAISRIVKLSLAPKDRLQDIWTSINKRIYSYIRTDPLVEKLFMW